MSTTEFLQVPLSLLKLSKDNPRFDAQPSQRAIIKKMLTVYGNEIYNLARDISERGLSPIDMILVSKSGKFYEVKEGNRRTVALKVLNNPDLLEDIDIDDALKRKLKSLKIPDFENGIGVVECNDDEMCRWMMSLKHQGKQSGVGTMEWGSLEKQRFSSSGETKSGNTQQELVIKLYDIVKESVSEDIPLDKFKITNLQRIFSDSKARSILGVHIEDGKLYYTHSPEKVIAAIKYLVEEIATDKLKVSNIYNSKMRTEYFNNEYPSKLRFDDSDKLESPELIVEISKDSSKSSKGKPTGKGNKKRKSHKLFKKNEIECNAESPKAIRLFNELSNLKVTDSPNACALVIRCLLEVSAKDKIRRCGKGDDFTGNELNNALTFISNPKNGIVKDNELSKTINRIRSSNAWGLMDLNDWAHSADIFASEKEARDFWDKYYNVFKFLLS